MVPPDQCVDVDRRGPSPSAQLLVGCSGQRGRWGEEGVRAPALALAFSRERARGETLRERVTSIPWPENVVLAAGLGQFPDDEVRRCCNGRHMHVHQGQSSPGHSSQCFNLCALKFRSSAGKIRGVDAGGQGGSQIPPPLIRTPWTGVVVERYCTTIAGLGCPKQSVVKPPTNSPTSRHPPPVVLGSVCHHLPGLLRFCCCCLRLLCACARVTHHSLTSSAQPLDLPDLPIWTGAIVLHKRTHQHTPSITSTQRVSRGNKVVIVSRKSALPLITSVLHF